jgi:hypothetical protein
VTATPGELLDRPQQAKQTELIAAVDALGGPASWGIEELHPDRYYADPGILLDRLLPPICELLNGAMRETPVEQLPNVHLTAADIGHPQDGAGTIADMFSAPQRGCVRALLGL